MKRFIAAMLLALLPALAVGQKGAAPKPDKKLSSAENKTYRQGLSEGRKLHKAKDYAGAVKAFEKALAVNPDDPRALSELGYAAFFAKDYKYAEESTKKALDRSSDPELRGATLYNLGLIYEANGKNADAITAYMQSLEARPNRVVREALAKLDPTKAALYDPLKPIALSGPYAKLDDWCKAAKADSSFLQTTVCLSSIDKKSPPYGVEGQFEASAVAAPYLAVRLVVAAAPLFFDEGSAAPATFEGSGEALYHVAIQTKKGWYVTEEGIYVYNPGAFGIYNDLSIKSIEVKDAIPGGQPEVLISYSFDSRDSDMAGAIAYYASSEETILCGVGPSGAPSCTNPLTLKMVSGVDTSLWDEAELGPAPEKSSEAEWSLSLSFLADGQLELKQGSLKKTKALPKETKALLGTRALAFP